MSVLTKGARERLRGQANHHASLALDYAVRPGGKLMAEIQSRKDTDLRAALAYIDALEAERDALANKLEAIIAPVEVGGGVVAHLTAERDALKARVALLAAECRASRAHDTCSETGRNRAATWSELCEARHQADAAGALS